MKRDKFLLGQNSKRVKGSSQKMEVIQLKIEINQLIAKIILRHSFQNKCIFFSLIIFVRFSLY